MAAWPTGCKVNLDWIEMRDFREPAIPAPHLEHVHGILVPGGFGQRGAEGKILAARFARERKVPYFGICFGMQMAVIEAARSLGRHAGRQLDRIRSIEGAGRRPDDRMAARQRAGKARGRAAISAARCGLAPIARELKPGSQDRADLRRDRDIRAPSPSLRGQHAYRERLEEKGSSSPACRRTACCRRRSNSRPSLVHRRAISSRTEVAAVRASPAVREFYRRRGGADRGWCDSAAYAKLKQLLRVAFLLWRQ